MKKNNSNIQQGKTEEELWSEKLGERLHLLFVDVLCLKHFVGFAKENPCDGKKFVSIFNYFYRVLFDRLYINIYNFLDNSKNVMSLKVFLKKVGKVDRWNQIQKHTVFIKIKEKRNNIIAHSNPKIVFSQDQVLEHHE